MEEESERCWLILKRGYYYRKDFKGYTGKKEEAGLYTLEEVALSFRKHVNEKIPYDSDGMDCIHWDYAPDYSPAFEHDSKFIIK